MIDILDADGKLTGSKAMKSEAHAKGLWHHAVHVWVFNSKGEVLLQERALNKESFSGLWDISSAGHIFAGETPDEAAARELEEELGIKVKQGDLKKLKVIRSEIETKPDFHNKEFCHIYLLRFDGDAKKLKIQKEELAGVKFMSLDDFKSELNDNEKCRAYVPNKAYFFGIIEALRKELDVKKF